MKHFNKSKLCALVTSAAIFTSNIGGFYTVNVFAEDGDNTVKTAQIELTDSYSKTLTYEDIPQPEARTTSVSLSQDWSGNVDFTDVDTENGETRFFSEGVGFNFNSWEYEEAILSAIETKDSVELPEGSQYKINDITVTYDWEFTPADETTVTTAEIQLGVGGNDASGEWIDSEKKVSTFDSNEGDETVSFSELTGIENFTEPRSLWINAGAFSKNANDTFTLNVTDITLDLTYYVGENGGYKSLYNEETDSGQWVFNAHNPDGGERAGDRSADIVAAIKAATGDETAHNAVRITDMEVFYSWNLETTRVLDNYGIDINPCPAGQTPTDDDPYNWVNAGMTDGVYAVLAEKTGTGSVKASDVMNKTGLTVENIHCMDIHGGMHSDNPADKLTFAVTKVVLDVEYTIQVPTIEKYITKADFDNVPGAQYIRFTTVTREIGECEHESHVGDDGIDNAEGMTYCPWADVCINKVNANCERNGEYGNWTTVEDVNHNIGAQTADKSFCTYIFPVSAIESVLGGLEEGERYVVMFNGSSSADWELLTEKPDIALWTGSYESGNVEEATEWNEETQTNVGLGHPNHHPTFSIAEFPDGIVLDGYNTLKFDYTLASPDACSCIGVIVFGWAENGIGWESRYYTAENSGTIAIDLSNFEGKSVNSIYVGPMAPMDASIGDTFAPGFAVTGANLLTSYDGEYDVPIDDPRNGNGNAVEAYITLEDLAKVEGAAYIRITSEISLQTDCQHDEHNEEGAYCPWPYTGIHKVDPEGEWSEDEYSLSSVIDGSTATWIYALDNIIDRLGELSENEQYVIATGDVTSVSYELLTEMPDLVLPTGSYIEGEIEEAEIWDDEIGGPVKTGDPNLAPNVVSVEGDMARPLNGYKAVLIDYTATNPEAAGGIEFIIHGWEADGTGWVAKYFELENEGTIAIDLSGMQDKTYQQIYINVVAPAIAKVGDAFAPGFTVTSAKLVGSYEGEFSEEISDPRVCEDYISYEDLFINKNTKYKYIKVTADIRKVDACEHQNHIDGNTKVDDAIGATYCPWAGVSFNIVDKDGQRSDACYDVWSCNNDFNSNIYLPATDKSKVTYYFPISDIEAVLGKISEGEQYVVTANGISEFTYEMIASKPDLVLNTGSCISDNIKEGVDWDFENDVPVPNGKPDLKPRTELIACPISVVVDDYKVIKIDYTIDNPEACSAIGVVIQGWDENGVGWVEKFYEPAEEGTIAIDLSEFKGKSFHNILAGPVAPKDAQIGDEFDVSFTVTDANVLKAYEGDFSKSVEDPTLEYITYDELKGAKYVSITCEISTQENCGHENHVADDGVDYWTDKEYCPWPYIALHRVNANGNFEDAAYSNLSGNVVSIGSGSPITYIFPVSDLEKIAGKLSEGGKYGIETESIESLEYEILTEMPDIALSEGSYYEGVIGEANDWDTETNSPVPTGKPDLRPLVMVFHSEMAPLKGYKALRIDYTVENPDACSGICVVFNGWDNDGTGWVEKYYDIEESGSIIVDLSEFKGKSFYDILAGPVAPTSAKIGDAFAPGFTVTGGSIVTSYDGEFSAEIDQIIPDAPVILHVNGKASAFDTLEEAANAIKTATGTVKITLDEDAEIKNLTLPTKATSIIIKGDGKLTIGNATLTIPCDTVIENDIASSYTKPMPVKVSAGKTLTLGGTTENIGAISGTATSKLIVNADVSCGGLSTFGEVETAEEKTLTVSGAVSGIALFNGTLKLTSASAAAAITNIGTAEIILVETEGKLPKTTVTAVEEALTLTIVNTDDETVFLMSGTPVLYTVKNNYTDKITITNETAPEKALNAFLYKTEIRAEYAGAVIMNEKKYPNLEKAFEDITDATVIYDIYLTTPATVKNLVMPKNAKEIRIDGEDLTVGNTKIAFNTDTILNCNIIADNKNGTLDISAAKDTKLNIHKDIVLNSLTGTATTDLRINSDVTVKNLSNFRNIEMYSEGRLTVNGSVKGITLLDGVIKLEGVKTTAAITNIATAEIILVETEGKLPKTTVTDVIQNLTLTVVDTDGETVSLTSGTPVLYTVKNNYTDKITITNETAPEKALNAFLYKTEIRAEYAGVMTMNGKGYPNFEKAFEAVTDPEVDYTITLNEPVYVKNLVMPKNAKSITIEGADLTVGNTKLALNTSTTFDCNIIADNKNGTLDISAAKDTTLTINNDLTLNALTGTATTNLVIDGAVVTVKNLSTFGNVTTEDGKVYANGSVKGITKLDGVIELEGVKTTAAITNIGDAEIILVETDGKLPKTTVTNVEEGLTLTVGDGGTLKSGTPVLYTVKNDYTDKITITNLSERNKELNAFLYKTEIRAEFAGAVTVNERNFPNLEKALESVTDPEVEYTITLNESAYVKNLVMPKKAKSVTITGEDLTVGNTKLALNTSTTLGCNIIADNKNGTLDISAAKGTTLTISNNLTLNALTGTATTNLVTDNAVVTVKNLSTFGSVTTEGGKIYANGSVKGITRLDGVIELEGVKTTAAITNIGNAEIILVETDGKLPKTTVTNVEEALTLTVGDGGTLKSGTPVLYTVKNDYTDKITITNKTAQDQDLSAFLYKTEIRAEYASAVIMNEEAYPNLEKALSDITDADKDYVITLRTPATVKNLVMPKKAKSVTITGENLTVGNTKLTLNTDTILDCNIIADNKNGTLDISAAKGTTLTISNNLTLNALTGTATTNLVINEADVTVKNLSTFGSVTTNDSEIYANGSVKGITKLDGVIKLEGVKTTAAITNIGNASIILVETEGKLPKTTVTDVTGNLTLIVENETGYVKSGTPVLYTVKNDYTGKIEIANYTFNDQELSAYLYNKEIRAEYEEALNMNGEYYPSFEKAFEVITAAKNTSENYNITLNTDVKTAKFALPTAAASITIISAYTYTIDIGSVTSISASSDLTLENIAFETTSKPVTINAKKNLTVDTLYGDVGAIKGTAKFALNWNGEGEETAKPEISGFGTVNVAEKLTTGKTFNVTKLVFADSESTLAVSEATTKSSVKSVDASNGGVISYEEGAKALTFTGKDADFIAGEEALTIAGDVVNGQAVLTTKNVSIAKLADGITAEDSEIEYTFLQMGKDICYMGKVLSLSYGDPEAEAVEYATWSEVVAAIEGANNAEAEYTITLLDYYNANSAIKFPKAGSYKQITIQSKQDEDVEGNEIYNFNFTGNITLTGNTMFTKINIGAVKNNLPAKYTISAGKYNLSIFVADTGLLTSISGTGFVSLFNAGADTIKAGDLYIGGDIVAKNGITAKNIIIDDQSAELVINQNSKLTISGNVTNDADSKLTVTVLNKTTGNPATLTKGYVLGTIRGTGVENILLDQTAHPDQTVELKSGKIVVA